MINARLAIGRSWLGPLDKGMSIDRAFVLTPRAEGKASALTSVLAIAIAV